MDLIRVDVDKCKKDGICVEVCPLGLLDRDKQGGPTVRPGQGQFCLACGHCVAVCPHGALDNIRSPLWAQEDLKQFPVIDAPTAQAFLRSRRSIRRYKEDSVPRETVLQLLNIARYAPSGHNSQGVSYLVVQSRDALQSVCDLVIQWMKHLVSTQPELANSLFMPGIIKSQERGEDRILRKAPVLIVATAAKELRAAQVTSTLALEYIELYATTLGLGTCWAGFAQFCAQQYPPLTDFLGIPKDKIVTGMMMVGYPKFRYHRMPERNPLDVTWL